MRRIAIVGGSLAGVHAAEALRERGFDGELTLVSADPHLPYDRPPVSKELLLGEMEVDRLLLRPPSWYDDQGIDLRLGVSARGLDPSAQTLVLSDRSELTYDGLVIATGSAARHLPAPPSGPKVHVLRDQTDALTLRERLVVGRHLVVVGGGFIGLEVAGIARRLGVDVTLVEGPVMPLGARLGVEVGDWYRRLHERNGVTLVRERAVVSVEGSPTGIVVILDDGTRLNGDLVVAGIGATPAVQWLAGSGLDLDDGVACTPDLATRAPHVVAAGDISRWRNPVFGQVMRVEHWSNAVEQGRHAAATLLGDREPYASVPYFWTDQHGAKMRFVGRAAGATDIRIESATDDKLVAVYGRDGIITGAVCVGAPRQLAVYKAAILNRVAWEDVHEPALSSRT